MPLILLSLILIGCAPRYTAERWLDDCKERAQNEQQIANCIQEYQARSQAQYQKRALNQQLLQMNSPQNPPTEPKKKVCIENADGIVQCFDK